MVEFRLVTRSFRPLVANEKLMWVMAERHLAAIIAIYGDWISSFWLVSTTRVQKQSSKNRKQGFYQRRGQVGGGVLSLRWYRRQRRWQQPSAVPPEYRHWSCWNAAEGQLSKNTTSTRMGQLNFILLVCVTRKRKFNSVLWKQKERKQMKHLSDMEFFNWADINLNLFSGKATSMIVRDRKNSHTHTHIHTLRNYNLILETVFKITEADWYPSWFWTNQHRDVWA